MEKGKSTLDNIVAADSTSEVLNDVAYELADANLSLPKALDYSLRAVDLEEEESQGTDLLNVSWDDLLRTRKVGNFWDTLGWVHFRMGHFDQAESYLHAAWLVSQNATEADHLGQVYEAQKRTEKAIHMYRFALATPEANGSGPGWDETRHRLEHLTGKKAPTGIDLLRTDANGSELSEIRTVKLARLVQGTASAQFYVLFAPGPKVKGVHFVGGSEKFKTAAEAALLQANFQVAFPEHSTANLVRRGILMCSEISGCNAVLFPPGSN